MKEKRYLSFSLWGSLPFYTAGALRNAELWPSIYPDWYMIVYHDQEVPQSILDQLLRLGVELVQVNDKEIHPSFWRFFILDRPDCARAIFRDTDSRISKRECMAVDDWIADDTILHVMRDHPFHQIPFGASEMGILAGMWGLKAGYVEMGILIENFVASQKTLEYGIDQTFLTSIYARFYSDSTIHDEFFGGRKFPIPREDYRFIGERIDEHELPVGDDWIHIMAYSRQSSKKRFFAALKNIFKK